MNKRISIIIPAYNEARYLPGCLDAIAAQTVMPYEVIVVDNNSTDKTVTIARRYPFVRVLSEKQQGTRFAERTGVVAAKGDIIGRIDADTLLTPTWCADVQALFADPTVTAVTGSCYYYDMPFGRLGLGIDRFFRRYAQAPHDVLLYGSNMAVRRTIWHELVPELCLVPHIFEDCDLSIHLRQRGKQIRYEPALLAGISARTLDLPFAQFRRYLNSYERTFTRHNVVSGTAKRARIIYVTLYPLFKLLRRLYDPKRQRLVLTRLFRRPNVRHSVAID